MATFLAALRFAVNVEDHLQHLQTDRFRHSGDTSTRILPPLVPIAGLAGMPRESTLDEFRKRHILEVAGSGARSVEAEDGEASVRPAAYSVIIHNYDAMVTDFSQTFGEPSGDLPPVGARPLLRLGWTGPVAPTSPPGLPQTRALWLCFFFITPGTGERWWNGCTWELLYSRRFSTRYRSKKNVSPPR